MSIQVKQVDTYGIKKRLKESGDKEALNFIKQLEYTLERQQEITAKAISKIRELSKLNNENTVRE